MLSRTMPTTCSYTWAEANQITPMIQARRARRTSTVSENPPFRLRYSNTTPNPNIDPPDDSMPPPQCPPIPGRRHIADPPRGRIEEVSEEPSEQPEAPGDPGDDGGDDGGGDDGGGNDDPDPDAKPKPDVADPIPIGPIPLHLFDGSINASITEAIELPLRFPDGHTQSVDFYVALLDSSISVVLGHNWLTRYNPLIDWVLGSITFRTPLSDPLVETQLASARAATAESEPPPKLEEPWVALLDAATFMRTCTPDGSRCFLLNLAPEPSARVASASADLVDLKDLPKEYHDFVDVFSKSKADTLALHRPYDLKIQLEDGASL
jgi:hypothetical protein